MDGSIALDVKHLQTFVSQKRKDVLHRVAGSTGNVFTGMGLSLRKLEVGKLNVTPKNININSE